MGKNNRKKAIGAKRHNEKTVASVLEGESHYLFGRVEKNFGAGGFQVRIDKGDAGLVVGMPMGKFTRQAMFIDLNSFVILEPSTTGRSRVLEIVGLLSRADAQSLYKQKRMAKCVWKMEEEQAQEVDDFFDYGEETEEVTTIKTKEDITKTKAKITKAVIEDIDDSDSDIDVDAI
jgi:hypothetical protein